MYNTLLDQIDLTPEEISAIKRSFKQIFLNNDQLWLFIDKTKKNGRISLYIETNIENEDTAKTMENQLTYALWGSIGEQTIDLVVNSLTINQDLPIYNIAKQSGIRLI